MLTFFSSAITMHSLLFNKFKPYLTHIENILKFTFPYYNVKMKPSGDGEFDSIKLGLGPNIRQFLVLVLVNAFVGAMIGLEQTVVPLMGKNVLDRKSTRLNSSHITIS